MTKFKSLLLALAAIFILNSGVVLAGELEDGAAAVDRKDYAAARKILIPLAQRGDRDAQRIVGFMYMYELGVPRDYFRAHLWWSLAASKGDSKSAEYRDIAARLLTPEQVAESKKKAAECAKQKYKGCN